MAGFSYQYPPFLLESSTNFLPNYTMNKMSSASFDESGNINNSISPSFPYSSSSPSHQSYNNNQEIPVYPDVLHCFDDNNQANCVTDQKHKADSSSMVIDLDCSDRQVTHEKKKAPHVEKKRRSRDGSCSTSAQSKDSKIDNKAKKQKKCSRNLKEMEEKKIKKKTNEQPQNGYVHLRARRGEATDSHSLAERVRREKISKRLKLLQGLVPGCDKVTSKALMLDEIINYVQSLQHQVEFLSMKLASLTPLFCDFGVNFHDLNTVKSEKLGNLESPLPTPSTTFAEITTTNNDSLQDGSISFLLQQGQMPNAFSQDNGAASWCLDDQRQRVTNQCGFTNLCSFQ